MVYFRIDKMLHPYKACFPTFCTETSMCFSLFFPLLFFYFSQPPGNKKIPSSPEPLLLTHTCLLDCSAFQDPVENCLFFEHLVDELQHTSWLLCHLFHPNLPSSGLFAAATTLKGSCPNGRFSVLFLCCFAWSYAAAGLLLERVPSSFGFLSLPTMEGGKYLVLCSTGCSGIKGRNQSLLVARDHLVCQKQPTQPGFPFQAGCDDSENWEDNELFMSRSCLLTLLQSCEWPVHEKHPGLWPRRGNLCQMNRELLPQQRKTHWLLKRPPESWPSHKATQRTRAALQLNEHVSLLLCLCSRRTLYGIPPALTHQLIQHWAWWKAEQIFSSEIRFLARMKEKTYVLLSSYVLAWSQTAAKEIWKSWCSSGKLEYLLHEILEEATLS